MDMTQPKGITTPQGRFDYAVNIILKHEGRFTNDKDDPGGATDYGISLRFLKSYGIDINDDGQINLEDIQDLDRDKACDIYRKYWWDMYGYNDIGHLLIATKIFDMAVNMGAHQAHKLTQRATNCLGYTLKVDGILGVKSKGEINEVCRNGRYEDLMCELIEEQISFYEDLVDAKPVLKKYLSGWKNRANSL